MSQWLAYTTDLVSAKSKSELNQKLIQNLTRALGLSKCELLLPNAEGRMLVAQRTDQRLAWQVDNLDCPFGHILQSSNSMLLSSEDLLFWQSDRQFAKLTANVGMFECVSIQPLPVGQSHVHAIAMMIGDKDRLSKVLGDDSFVQFLQVYSHQLDLLSNMEKGERGRKDLAESYSDFQKDTKQKELASILESTLIGDSVVMNKLRTQIARAADSSLSVMVQGETGTGKELVAQAIHDLSSRREQPFVAINCAAIPENLLESELFGYAKGAFSGAEKPHDGLLLQANGGTLFLDEIGDMPLPLQAKLLRVLETKTFRPVGGKQELSSDFRLVSATHVNLNEQVRQRLFRQDLYYRLFQYPLSLPKLAERLVDIEQLSEHFISDYNQSHNTQVRGIDYRALDLLHQYHFPGNVRELKHLIEFGCAQTLDGEVICPRVLHNRLPAASFEQIQPSFEEASVYPHLQQDPKPKRPLGTSEGQRHRFGNLAIIDDLKKAITEYEAEIIRDRLAYFSGDRGKAARSLGIPKRTLAYKCQKLEL